MAIEEPLLELAKLPIVNLAKNLLDTYKSLYVGLYNYSGLHITTLEVII